MIQSAPSLGWNAQGHQLIANIAYQHISPKTKIILNRYNRALSKQGYVEPTLASDKNSLMCIKQKTKQLTWCLIPTNKSNHERHFNIINASVWLDRANWRKISKAPNFKALHYITIFFSSDKTPLPSVNPYNAMWAIERAQSIMLDKLATDVEKGIALRILLHVVGDIHQPLHTISRVSTKWPHGDKGGNKVILNKNPIGFSLHQYWDRGGGYLLDKSQSLKLKTALLEERWPCQKNNELDLNPRHWIQASHMIGENQVYTLNHGNKPDSHYQQMVIETSQKQIALAGCRLAALLDKITL